MIVIQGPTYHSDKKTIPDAKIVVNNGKLSVNNTAKATHKFPREYHLIPGMIDMHIHGSCGYDVMDATPEALQTIADSLLKQGTTGFLATTMTGEIENIEAALINAAEFAKQQTSGAKVLGVHLEGPFIAPEFTGAQRRELIISPDIKLFQRWQEKTNNVIKMVTIAPEQKNSTEFIQYLKKTGVIASFGHSNADYKQTNQAIDDGITHATHLFNAMRGIHHRQPGAVTALLLRDEVYAELICDNIHLVPAIIDLAYRMKTADRLILVTDATRAQCMKDGEYELGGQKIIVQNKAVHLADGTLAGSVLTLPEAMKYTIEATGCDLSDIVKMTSTNPSDQLNINTRGAVLLDAEYNVVDVFL
jgi:N-acetylglucosamine-6-phosphate deacetylase